jgi:large subunit ribosomal protein L32
MAVPFRRTSKTHKRLRRTHFKLAVPTLVKCPHCGASIKPHTVCPKCGYYDGKQIIAVKTKTTSEKK